MHVTPLAAAGIIEDWTGLGKDVKTLLTVVVLGIIYIASIAATWAATRSMLKAGVAAVGGAMVLGIIASQTVLSSKTAEELKKDHTVGQGVPIVRVAAPEVPLSTTPAQGREGSGRQA
ncbi:hypothetical protein ACOKM5_43895 [Streptomyces sp. BH097]|uniref:hypothetical protein n=1 Tax=unclassified Streptomyces TaxID=2593676 RepID=UPI003BB62CE3